MSRSVAQILSSLIGKLPIGFALGKRGGVLDALLEGIAAPIADAEASAEALMDEVDPRAAVALLPDFERVLGPDPCGRDVGPPSLGERQRIAHQRWTATGGQSLPYLISVAARLGVTIQIDEFWPSKAGVLRAGQPLIADGEQFVWRVKLAPIGEFLFRAGAGRAGDPLGWIVISAIECELRRIAHSHTRVVFSYVLEEA
ncbi:YmfQ family protein [Amorphus coralli]|uniref:YmfQ family protein n=1 Tax=Amorphus coralli TaxID=340680 RepID=UPI00036874C8|nr:putative phage tail protein [Amorphus coralli]